MCVTYPSLSSLTLPHLFTMKPLAQRTTVLLAAVAFAAAVLLLAHASDSILDAMDEADEARAVGPAGPTDAPPSALCATPGLCLELSPPRGPINETFTVGPTRWDQPPQDHGPGFSCTGCRLHSTTCTRRPPLGHFSCEAGALSVITAELTCLVYVEPNGTGPSFSLRCEDHATAAQAQDEALLLYIKAIDTAMLVVFVASVVLASFVLGMTCANRDAPAAPLGGSLLILGVSDASET